MKIGELGEVISTTSRSGLHLRVAVAWVGQRLSGWLRGWTLIGEIEAGTHWSHEQRELEEKRSAEPVVIPRFHLFTALDSQGRQVANDRVRKIGSKVSHPRLQNIRQATWSESWRAFTTSIFEAGGEGVVIREGGSLWKAKPILSIDRFVSRVFAKKDSTGHWRTYAALSVCTSEPGEKPSFRKAQTVLVPEGVTPSMIRGRVVVVVGSTEDQKTGVVRHARLVSAREPGDKEPCDCRIGQVCQSVPECARDDEGDASTEGGSGGTADAGVELSRGSVEAEDERELREQDIDGDGEGGDASDCECASPPRRPKRSALEDNECLAGHRRQEPGRDYLSP